MPANVDNPQQNDHKFWGTLVDDDGKKSFFVKLSCDAHYISYGTIVETGREFNSASEAKKVLVEELKKIDPKFDSSSIELPEGKYFEIIAIDPKTSALTKALKQKTEELFWNDDWLATNSTIGVDAIKAGRQLPPLSKR